MSKGMMITGIIILGVLTLACVNLIQNYQSGNELDYYLLKETTEAAMIDGVDWGYYRTSGGIIRVDREKFLESFVRRFADSVSASSTYRIKIIDFNETPPKASIQVGTTTVASFVGEDFDIITTIDGILETKYNEKRKIEEVE
jgi:lipoprotein